MTLTRAPRIVTALALATALAAPAQADFSRQDRNRLLLGVAVLGLIGLAANEQAQRREEDRARERARRTLPSGCLVAWQTADGPIQLLDGDCLEAGFAHAADLPLTCAVTIRAAGRFESGFHPGCLAAEGYRLSVP